MWTKLESGILVLEYLTDKTLLNLPMPHDDVFKFEQKNWKTAVDSYQSLFNWFTKQDILQMTQHGFILKQIECNDVIIQPNQILFNDNARLKEEDITWKI